MDESLIKPEKIEALKNAKASLCDDCMCSVWSMTETCHDKVELMFYGIRQSSMLDVLVSVMTNPACNKSSEAGYMYYISFSKVTENEKLKKKQFTRVHFLLLIKKKKGIGKGNGNIRDGNNKEATL